MAVMALPAEYLDNPPVTPVDRLALTTFLAIVLHLIVILGVGFTFDTQPRVSHNNLEIVLVSKKSDKPPDDARLLAQASQQGGGESDQLERPSAPLPAPLTSDQATIPDAAPPPSPPPPPAPTLPEPKLMTGQVAEARVAVAEQPRTRPRPPTELPRPSPEAEQKPHLSAAALVSRSLEMASLNARLDQKLKNYAERPVRKFINARTREYKYAAYMEAWRAKVERIGNLNYPDEARRQKLSGSLMLDVALNPDGTINEIVLRRSSGHRVLDDAAIRIVRLAAPFAPFPEDIRSEADILHIERTWQFLGTNRLFAR